MTRDRQSPYSHTAAINVVAVEDNPADLELIKELLQGNSHRTYQIVAFDHLKLATDYLKSNSADVVLLDLNLPDSQGISTFQKIHAAVPKVPILILTGFADEKLALDTLKEGAEDYIFKDDLNESMIDRVIRYSIERSGLKSEILENQQLRELILEVSNFGYLILNEDNQIIYANNLADKLLGRNRQDILSQEFHRLAKAEHHTRHQFVDESGQIVTYEITATPLQWKSEPAYLVTLINMTRRLEMETLEKKAEALNQTQKLAGAIAHEFSQPLQILGYTIEFIKMENGESERLQMLKRNVNRITQLVENLRQIVRVQNRPYLSTEIMDLARSSNKHDSSMSIEKSYCDSRPDHQNQKAVAVQEG